MKGHPLLHRRSLRLFGCFSICCFIWDSESRRSRSCGWLSGTAAVLECTLQAQARLKNLHELACRALRKSCSGLAGHPGNIREASAPSRAQLDFAFGVLQLRKYRVHAMPTSSGVRSPKSNTSMTASVTSAASDSRKR